MDQQSSESRRRRRISVGGAVLATASILLSATAAEAAPIDQPGRVVGVFGGVAMSGMCQTEHAAAGVGNSGGVTYEVQGAGTAVAADVLDTQVGCKIIQDGAVKIEKWSTFTPGDAAAVAGSFSSNSLDALRTCVDVHAFLKNGTIAVTHWHDQNGDPC